MSWIKERREWIAVLGGATRYDRAQITAAFEVGRQIARCKKHLVTGGTSGVPYAAAIGAKMEGGLVVGISPAASEEEHANHYKKPLDNVDMMVYSGMNVDGRSPLIIRSAGAAIFIGGEFGTLNEFTSAWLNGRSVVGVLEGFGGISESMRGLLRDTETSFGSAVFFDSEPNSLVRQICTELTKRSRSKQPYEGEDTCGADVREMVEAYLESGVEKC